MTGWTSACGESGCVELRWSGRSVEMRNSSKPDLKPYTFTIWEWEVFHTAIRAMRLNRVMVNTITRLAFTPEEWEDWWPLVWANRFNLAELFGVIDGD